MISHHEYSLKYLQMIGSSAESDLKGEDSGSLRILSNWSYLSSEALKFAQSSFLLNGDKDASFQGLEIASVASLIFWMGTEWNKKTVSLIHPQRGTFQGKIDLKAGNTYEMLYEYGVWVGSIQVQILVRNGKAKDLMCSKLFRQLKYSQKEPWRRSYAEFLQSLLTGKKDAPQKLKEAYENTFPGKVKRTSPRFIENEIVPELELYIALVKGDPTGFNSQLEKTLLAHKLYAASHEFPEEPSLLLPTSYLSIAALAYDMGIPIEVKSDYLPEWLVKGEFPKKWSAKVQIR